jgi:hypothetical protein
VRGMVRLECKEEAKGEEENLVRCEVGEVSHSQKSKTISWRSSRGR